MALIPASRRKGLALALAMAATFPSVFLFQAAAAPLLAAMVIGMAWLSGILDPASTVTHVTTNGLVAAMIFGTALLVFVAMLTVSILGFFEGWLLGWRCAHGERFRDVIKRGPTARLLRRLGFRKLHHAS
jgi:ABC-type phosphate transport system permease subunit